MTLSDASLKGKIRAMAKKGGLKPQELLQMYLFEHLLLRLEKSPPGQPSGLFCILHPKRSRPGFAHQNAGSRPQSAQVRCVLDVHQRCAPRVSACGM